MRPTIKFLSDQLIRQIISEATDILCTLGVEIHNKAVLYMLSEFGCTVDMEKSHAVLTNEIIDKHTISPAITSISLRARPL